MMRDMVPEEDVDWDDYHDWDYSDLSEGPDEIDDEAYDEECEPTDEELEWFCNERERDEEEAF